MPWQYHQHNLGIPLRRRCPVAANSPRTDVMQQLKQRGAIEGWREEPYPITTAFDQPPLAVVERAAAVYLGIKSYGVHLNG